MRRTASMEQAADTAEAAAVDRYFSSSTDNIFSSSLPKEYNGETDWSLFCNAPSVCKYRSYSYGYNKYVLSKRLKRASSRFLSGWSRGIFSPLA